MKKIILVMLLTILYTSCGNLKQAKESINVGNYDNTISIAIEKLKKNKFKKGNQPYILVLQEAFEKVTKRDLEQIKFLEKEGNPENLEIIYNKYLILNDRQELIKPLLPLPILEKGENAVFEFADYSNDIIATKKQLSELLYTKAKILFNSKNKKELRSVFYDLEYLDRINPNYKDTRVLMNDAHARGTDFVYISMKNETQKVIPKRLEEDLLNIDTYGLDDIWTIYHSRENPKIEYDFGLELNFRRIDISPEKIRERQIIKEKQVKDGYKYLLDTNGNQVLDTLGNKIKVDKFINVRCELYEFTQSKSTKIVGQVKYFDFQTQQYLQVFPIESEFIFENTYANYSGDKRALDSSFRNLIGMRFVQFPSNEQMIYDTGRDLKERLKQIIVDNEFRSY